MENKINIAEILKDKPQGIRLYSPIFGECAFYYVCEDTDDICVKRHNGEKAYFNPEGLYNTLGEVMLFPSREMRDWSKFSWKKGDVLVSKDNVYITFEEFEDDTYTRFKGKHYLWKEYDEEDYSKEETKMLTSKFEKVNNNDTQTYINTIEERLGGTLNRETLEIEKQYEFKDGDVAFADFGNTQNVFIVLGKTKLSDGYYSFVVLNLNTTKALNIGYKTSFFKENLYTMTCHRRREKTALLCSSKRRQGLGC